jgi:hypothetical protein
MPAAKKAKPFTVPELLAPFIEIIDGTKVRFNFTTDRMQSVVAVKGHEAFIVDLAKIGSLEIILGLFASAVVKMLSGAPSKESVTQKDRPLGSEWEGKDVTQKANKKGDKFTWSRPLNDDEKLKAAIAHVEFKIQVLYGEAELQSRTANIHPLGEELRMVVQSAVLQSGMADSAGVRFTEKSIPSVFCKPTSSLMAIEAAASALGIGPKMLATLMVTAQENLDRKDLDGILDGMDMSV